MVHSIIDASLAYEALSNLGPSEALRAAQMELRKDRPQPYFWGAFICQGDPAA